MSKGRGEDGSSQGAQRSKGPAALDPEKLHSAGFERDDGQPVLRIVGIVGRA